MSGHGVRYGVVGWCGVGGGVGTADEWGEWAGGRRELLPVLPEVSLEVVPGRMWRRLGRIGRCVMYVCAQCLPMLESEPAVICVSRHGDLPLMDQLVQCAREGGDISPTMFTYSVHNRFSSVLSIFAGYRGVNAAYSSVRDGFLLGMAEAVALIEAEPKRQVLVVAYEGEMPEAYGAVVAGRWLPHAVAVVVKGADDGGVGFSLWRHGSGVGEALDSGSCLPWLRAVLNKGSERDGFWEHRYEG